MRGSTTLLLGLVFTFSTACKSRLAQAVEHGDQGSVLYYLGTSFDAKGNVAHYASNPNERINGKPLLTVAIEKGNIEIAKLLAQTEGTDISAVDVWGMTPLHVAVAQCNTEIAITLLKYRADPNAKAPRKRLGHTNPISTPLEGAVNCHNWPLFSALLLHGAKPDAAAFSASVVNCNSAGYDPRYTIALTRRHPNVIDQLSATERSAVYGCRDVLSRAMESQTHIDLVEPK